MKKIFLVVILPLIAFCYVFNIKALSYGGCGYSEISRLRNFVSNVNLSYDYYILNNLAYFNVTVSNLVPDVYFVDSSDGAVYYYDASVDGEIIIRDIKKTSGNLKFYSAKQDCYGVKLGNKYYNLPTYNIYYNDELCKKNSNFSLCQKWVKVNYSRDEFEMLIKKYNTKENYETEDEIEVVYKKTILDHFVNFYVKYYHITLIGIIAVCVLVMVVSRKKNKFDL